MKFSFLSFAFLFAPVLFAQAIEDRQVYSYLDLCLAAQDGIITERKKLKELEKATPRNEIAIKWSQIHINDHDKTLFQYNCPAIFSKAFKMRLVKKSGDLYAKIKK